MQKIIFRKDNKSFNKINNITLFEGEENADYLEILIPQKYNEIDLSDFNIRLTYITSDDSEKSFLIDEYKQEILHKEEFLVYLINIDKRFTSVVGEIKMYLTFSKPGEKDILFTSGVATIYIKDHPSGSNELTEKELDIIDQVVLISNKALNIAESLENRVNSGEFFPTIEVTETENGHNVTFKTEKQDKTFEVKDGDDYVITDEDKTEITQDVIEAVTPNIDEQVAKAGEILDEKATQKANEINASLDEHKAVIISDVNTVTNNNIDNINAVTNTHIVNINNITNNVVETIIPNAKNGAVSDISNVKTNALNDIANQKNIALNDIVNRENIAMSNLSNQENTLADNLNEAANQHIININTKADEKIAEIDSKVTNVEERADNGEFDGFSPISTVTKQDNGVKITIEDRNGITSEEVLNGEKGFSPTIETEKVENKTKITITNETGISETYISDGVVPVYNEESDYVVFKNAQLEGDGLINAIYGGEE